MFTRVILALHTSSQPGIFRISGSTCSILLGGCRTRDWHKLIHASGLVQYIPPTPGCSALFFFVPVFIYIFVMYRISGHDDSSLISLILSSDCLASAVFKISFLLNFRKSQSKLANVTRQKRENCGQNTAKKSIVLAASGTA